MLQRFSRTDDLFREVSFIAATRIDVVKQVSETWKCSQYGKPLVCNKGTIQNKGINAAIASQVLYSFVTNRTMIYNKGLKRRQSSNILDPGVCYVGMIQ